MILEKKERMKSLKATTKIQPLNYLSDQEIELIHEKTIFLIENIGLKIHNKSLVKRLKEAGAKVQDEIVKFSQKDFEKALNNKKKEFTLYGTEESKSVTLNKDTKLVESYSNALKYYDYETKALRNSTYRDLCNFTKVSEELDIVDVVGPGCVPGDVKREHQIFLMAKGLLTNTTKPVAIAPQNVKELKVFLDINQMIMGSVNKKDKPRFSITISPTSPFQLDYDTSENFLYSIEHNLPILAAPCPMGGGTSPFTLAGTLLLTNAESMYLFICSQMLNPGQPFIKGGASCIMDMRNASVAYGSPERNLIIGANGQLANWYDLPSGTPGSSVDAWEPDVQMGYQKMHVFLTRMLGYGTYCVSVGSILNGIAISCEQAILDAEMIKCAARITRGIKINEDTLALDTIMRVGHGGDYLTDEHTFKWLEEGKENEFMQLININGPEGNSMLEMAHKEVISLLERDNLKYGKDVIKDIDDYIQKLSEGS